MSKDTLLADLKAKIGKEEPPGEWTLVDQERINRFADATEDHQWIHVDPARAKKESPARESLTTELGGVDNVTRAMKRATSVEITKLESYLTFLATTASAAPFIGLFGTVWGIMNAFMGLSVTHSSSIQAVAPGIAEALIATAVGLAAAIPALLAYNYFVQQIKVLAVEMDNFSHEFLNIAERHFFK